MVGTRVGWLREVLPPIATLRSEVQVHTLTDLKALCWRDGEPW